MKELYAAQRTKDFILSQQIGVVKTVITPKEYMRSLAVTIDSLGNMPRVPPF